MWLHTISFYYVDLWEQSQQTVLRWIIEFMKKLERHYAGDIFLVFFAIHSMLRELQIKLKNFQQDLCRVKGYAVQNKFYLKSYIEDYLILQLGTSADSAWIEPIWLSYQASGFYGFQYRISNKIYSEPLMHALKSSF